jgi:hypothetical protein
MLSMVTNLATQAQAHPKASILLWPKASLCVGSYLSLTQLKSLFLRGRPSQTASQHTTLSPAIPWPIPLFSFHRN